MWDWVICCSEIVTQCHERLMVFLLEVLKKFEALTASFHKLNLDPAQLGNGSDQPGLAVASAHSSVKNKCVEEAVCMMETSCHKLRLQWRHSSTKNRHGFKYVPHPHCT